MDGSRRIRLKNRRFLKPINPLTAGTPNRRPTKTPARHQETHSPGSKEWETVATPHTSMEFEEPLRERQTSTPGESNTLRRLRVNWRDHDTPATPRDIPVTPATPQDRQTSARIEPVEDVHVDHHPINIDMDGSENIEALRVRTPVAPPPRRRNPPPPAPSTPPATRRPIRKTRGVLPVRLRDMDMETDE